MKTISSSIIPQTISVASAFLCLWGVVNFVIGSPNQGITNPLSLLFFGALLGIAAVIWGFIFRQWSVKSIYIGFVANSMVITLLALAFINGELVQG